MLSPLQLCFSADGNFLYTGARKDPSILCWDVRYGSGLQAGTGERNGICQLLTKMLCCGVLCSALLLVQE